MNQNYNIYQVGAEPIYRDWLDDAPSSVFVEMRYKIPFAGKTYNQLIAYFGASCRTFLEMKILNIFE